MECARDVIYEDYPTEYAASRLPLPPGAINKSQITAVVDKLDTHPLRQPPKNCVKCDPHPASTRSLCLRFQTASRASNNGARPKIATRLWKFYKPK